MDEIDLHELLEAAAVDEPPAEEDRRASRARAIVSDEEPETDG